MSPLSIKYPVSVVILYVDGKSADVEDIKNSIKNIKEALINRGHIVRAIEVNKKNWRKAIHTLGQVFFNFVEDENWTLYKKVAWELEKLGKAQVAHDANIFEFVINKKAMKRKLVKANISTPKYRTFSSGDKYIYHIRRMDYPLIVKPSGQHAGVGISQDSVVIDENEAIDRVKYLYKYIDDDVLVEEFIDGREVTVTMIGNGKTAQVLPVAELIYGGEYNNNWPIYSFNAKWKEGTWEYRNIKLVCPADLHPKLNRKIINLAKKTFMNLKIRDVVRMDMRIDDRNDNVYVIDINASPNLSKIEYEGTYLSARALGWSYEDMIETIVAVTYRRVFGKMPDRIRERQLMLMTAN